MKVLEEGLAENGGRPLYATVRYGGSLSELMPPKGKDALFQDRLAGSKDDF